MNHHSGVTKMKRNISLQWIGYFVLFLIMNFISSSTMVTGQELPQPLQRAAEQLKKNKIGIHAPLRKLDSRIFDEIQRMKSAHELDETKYSAAATLETDSQGKIHVILRTTEVNASLIAALAQKGFELELSTENLNITPNLHAISGWAPLHRIEEFAQLAQIFHIRPAEKPISLSGEIITEGDQILRADLARQSFNISGAGQKVGVISTGIDHLVNSQSSRDLPSTVEIVNNRFNGDEGTAMLEIIHDIAPGASLAFADRGNSETDFINNIILLKNAGCTVICDDILFPLEPVYEDGAIAQTIDNIVNNNNIVYVSAAGNQHLAHYESDFVDNDNDGWHNFSADDETMNILLAPGAEITAVLQWNNQFGKAADDYDLHIYNEQLTAELASSTNIQDGNDDPVEKIIYKNAKLSATTIHLCIKKFAGQNRNLSLYLFGAGASPQQYIGTGGAIYGHAAAQNCLSVGAIDAKDAGRNDIQPTSNRGPTRIYSYDANGNPITFVDRPKPDHCAIDGVKTKVGQSGYFPNPFFGTSAAAAHSAGIAALLRQTAPQMQATQMINVINSTAIDLGIPGFDSVFGHGRIDAYDAANYLVTNAPVISVNPDSISVTLDKGTAITRKLVIANSGKSDLIYDLTWQPSSLLKMNHHVANSAQAYATDHSQSHSLKSLSSASKDISSSRKKLSLEKNSSASNSELILFEGFEAAMMPPAGWEKINGPSSPGGKLPAHWDVDSSNYIFSGQYTAVCSWGLNLDEWLITPSLNFSNVESPAVSFWWLSSYFWHVHPNDNGDLFIKVSSDGGRTWKTLWTFGDIGLWDDFVWYYTIIDLSDYGGKSNVKLAFNVIANDNADIAIDEIAVWGEIGKSRWIQFNPVSGTIAPGSSQVVDVLINSVVDQDTLDVGKYFGNINITSNDNEHQLVQVPVNLQIIHQLDIKGTLRYYSAQAMVIDNATLRLTGDAEQSIVSGMDGKYEFMSLNEGNYMVISEKSDDTRQAITPYDASLILQYYVGLISFTPYQKIAGDVTGNGAVTPYDAALILLYTVNQDAKFPIGKEWTFMPHDFLINDENWNVVPNSRSYFPLKNNQLNQDFLGVLYGDVSGNWGNSNFPLSGGSAQISIKNMEQQNDGKILLPVSIKFQEAAYSGLLRMKFDQHNLKFVSCEKTIQSPDSALLEAAASSEIIRVAFAASTPFDDNELTIKLLFEKIGDDDINLSNFNILELIVDDKTSLTTEVAEKNKIGNPAYWQLGQNYPNPFNSVTAIHYSIPEVSYVKLMVYNLVGQKLTTLVDGIKQPGHYRVSWNGCDDRKRFLGSGIYIYKLQAGKYEATKKMVLLP